MNAYAQDLSALLAVVLVIFLAPALVAAWHRSRPVEMSPYERALRALRSACTGEEVTTHDPTSPGGRSAGRLPGGRRRRRR